MLFHLWFNREVWFCHNKFIIYAFHKENTGYDSLKVNFSIQKDLQMLTFWIGQHLHPDISLIFWIMLPKQKQIDRCRLSQCRERICCLQYRKECLPYKLYILYVFFLYKCSNSFQDNSHVYPKRECFGIFYIQLFTLICRHLSWISTLFYLDRKSVV